jgi:hypothetical protein
MSKTVVGALEVVAGITIALVVPGGLYYGATLAAAGVATLLIKTPVPKAVEQSLKSPTPARVSAYGYVRLHGAYILFTNYNGQSIDVWAFHDGRIYQIIQVFLGDRRVQVNTADGSVSALEDGTFKGRTVFCGWTLGEDTGTAFDSIVSRIPQEWGTDHRGDGVVTGWMICYPVKSKDYSTVYSTGGPNQTPMSLVMAAQLCFDWRDPTQSVTDPSTWTFTENVILHLAHYLLVRAFKDWNLHFVPTLAYWTAAANDADIRVPLKGVQTILTFTRKAGDNFVQVYDVNGLRAGMTINIYVSGANQYTEARVVTSISGGQINFDDGLVYDHPQGSQVAWISSSTNPATEARYRSCVAHEHTTAHKDVLAHLLACCDGWLAPRSDGALMMFSGRYYEPTVTIGPDVIVSYSFQQFVAEEEALNTIKISYVSANHDYNTVDTDDWTDEDDIADRGKILSDTLANQVPSYSQARRLAKRKLSQVMAPYRGTVTTTAAGRIAIGQRFLRLTITEAGTTFYDGPAEVTKMTRNLQTGGCTFDWIAADPNVDAWNPATEEGNPAPVGNRAALQPLATPTIVSAVAYLADNSAAGTPGSQINIVAAGANRDDVTWYVRTRTTGSAVWNEGAYADIDAGDTVQLQTGFVASDASVDVEVAYGLGDGRISDYSATTVVDTNTDVLAPGPVTSFTANGTSGLASATWTNPTSANYSLTRIYRGTTNSFSAATLVASQPGSRGAPDSYTENLSAGTYYYWAVAVSVNGIASSTNGPKTAVVT